MFLYKNKIVITGGNGRFGQVIKRKSKNFKFLFLFPEKNELNILNPSSIKNYLKKTKTKYLINGNSR
jgi:dTDP-4-dehydrorhamnose reductase